MVKISPTVPRTGRVTRRPSHAFQIRQKPWIIQPFMVAPVLPGETMKNLLMQARVVSDPVKNPLIGWWQEYYFFYVKHRDLEDIKDHMEAMMLDQDHDLSSLDATGSSVKTYRYGTTIDWVKRCLDKIVEEYFRNEDDVTAHEIDNLPICSINQSTWLDSVINDADYLPAADVNLDAIDGNASDNLMASDVDAGMRMWQFARLNGLTDMDYEDYLATFGIKMPKADQPGVPELVRYIRKWTYPANTVDPATGSPSSALSWAIQDRADKDRFFKEPGFLIGLTISRPKVYLKGQTGTVTGLMKDAFAWLPAIMRDDPYTSLRKVPAASGPLSGNTDAYWLDLKDLFLYGEQFVNFALTETNAGIVALPTAGLNKRYVASADIDALFTDAAGGKNMVRQDGVVQLTILGGLRDTTPSVSRQFL